MTTTSLSSSTQMAMQGSPAASSHCRRRQLRLAVGEIFANVAVANADMAPTWQSATQPTFDSLAVPGISVDAYFSQISKHDHRSERSWLYALILADNFCRQAQVIVSPVSVHRIAACSLLMALKMTCDTSRINGAVAPLAGVSQADLNTMERHWLTSVGFNLNIHPDYYTAVARNLGAVLEHSRALRSGGRLPYSNLIPDEIRVCFVSRSLHDYRPGFASTPLLGINAGNGSPRQPSTVFSSSAATSPAVTPSGFPVCSVTSSPHTYGHPTTPSSSMLGNSGAYSSAFVANFQRLSGTELGPRGASIQAAAAILPAPPRSIPYRASPRTQPGC